MAPIHSREPAFPGIIPGGMARGQNSRDEWLYPQRGTNCSRVTPARQLTGEGSSTLSLFIPGHRPLIVYTRGVA